MPLYRVFSVAAVTIQYFAFTFASASDVIVCYIAAATPLFAYEARHLKEIFTSI